MRWRTIRGRDSGKRWRRSTRVEAEGRGEERENNRHTIRNIKTIGLRDSDSPHTCIEKTGARGRESDLAEKKDQILLHVDP